MPNIEIHGAPGAVTGPRSRICAAFVSAPYADKIVISIASERVINLKGKEEPFLRICATKDGLESHLEDMLKRLEHLKFGIEILELRDFIEVK